MFLCQVDGYICNERSYRDLNRLEKMLEDAKSSRVALATTVLRELRQPVVPE